MKDGIAFHVCPPPAKLKIVNISGCYNKTYDPGTYVCVVCSQPLFSSDTKYDSGCGWPAFNDVLDKGRVKLSPDTSGGKDL